jgi:sulfur carrier protein
MKLTINGSPREYDGPPELKSLLEALEIRHDRRGVAVAVNGEVIPRRDHGEVRLSEEDRIEVIEAVQGG